MGSVAKPARIEVFLDEAAIARGDVSRYSVRVEIEWRKVEEDELLGALRAELPPPVAENLRPLQCTDGRVELFPASTLKAWRRVGVGYGDDFTSFYDIARRHPEGMREPKLTEAIEYATGLSRRCILDFDAYPLEQRAEYVARTIERVDAVFESLEDLTNHLRYATPGGRKAVPPVKDPGRDVRAAVFRDVHGWSTRRIGEELKVRAPADSADKRENEVVRKMINERGRPLLERAFGADGWEARVERMKAARARVERARTLRAEKYERPGAHRSFSKQEFYVILAEYRATSPEEEERAAKEDGFDERLDEWMNAWANEDFGRAVNLQRSDRRFSALSLA